MALKSCKECGRKISTKADACPNCGAKAPKKTSAFTWLVLFFILAIVYAMNKAPSGTSRPIQPSLGAASSSDSATAPVVEQKKPTWSTRRSADEMTGEMSSFASSPSTRAKRGMSFPYQDTRAWLGVGCDGKNEWAYIGFSAAPNLDNTDTEDGYNTFRTRVKWDDTVEDTKFTQDWGASFVHFRNDSAAISRIASANTAVVELAWHGQQTVHFEFALRGSSSALGKIRSECAGR